MGSRPGPPPRSAPKPKPPASPSSHREWAFTHLGRAGRGRVDGAGWYGLRVGGRGTRRSLGRENWKRRRVSERGWPAALRAADVRSVPVSPGPTRSEALLRACRRGPGLAVRAVQDRYRTVHGPSFAWRYPRRLERASAEARQSQFNTASRQLPPELPRVTGLSCHACPSPAPLLPTGWSVVAGT